MEVISEKPKTKIHIITIENHSDYRQNEVSILDIQAKHRTLTYSYRDAEGNDNYTLFLEDLKRKKEKIVKMRMHVNCEYRKFREKQINQWVTVKGLNSSLACPFRLDPYQFQVDVVEFSIETVTYNFRLDDPGIDLVLQYLMPDTTIQFTILTEQL